MTTTPDQGERLPTDPKRVKAFALFFKRYMSISTLIVASLPIPVTSLGLIPTFSAQTKLLSVYTPLFCFLGLGFIFYSRHQLARVMFPEYFGSRDIRGPEKAGRMLVNLLPLFFIAASIVSTFQYNDVLNLSVGKIQAKYAASANYQGTIDFNMALQRTGLSDIWYSSRLLLLYISIFLTAEAAFIMMAVKEYLQDLAGLTEMDLIRGPRPKPEPLS